MFSDSRSKKLVLVSHCILNANSVSDGTADYPSIVNELVDLFQKHQIGILQLPCPELNCLGLDRGNIHGTESPVIVENSRIRIALSEPEPFNKMKELVKPIIYQVEQYLKYNFKILGVIGINRSPSCGISTTSVDDKEISGMGLFMETLKNELIHVGIEIPMIGIKTSRIDESIKEVMNYFELQKDKNSQF